MFCLKCGKQIPDESDFCPFCGANIAVLMKNGTQVKEDKPSSEQKPQETKPIEKKSNPAASTTETKAEEPSKRKFVITPEIAKLGTTALKEFLINPPDSETITSQIVHTNRKAQIKSYKNSMEQLDEQFYNAALLCQNDPRLLQGILQERKRRIALLNKAMGKVKVGSGKDNGCLISIIVLVLLGAISLLAVLEIARNKM